MSYSAAPNFAAGNVLTEAQLDILSDDITFLANPPKARVYNSAAISIPDNTVTPLTFNNERRDTDTMHSNVTNTGRITFTTAGDYLVGFSGALVGAADYAAAWAAIRLNGTTYLAIGPGSDSDGTQELMLYVATVEAFSAGDYVEIIVFQNNTANVARNLNSANRYSPEAWAIWQSL